MTELRALVGEARRDVQVLRAGRVEPALLLTARGVLLGALEDYVDELTRCRLPVPPGLRDDLRLQRTIPGIRRSPAGPGPRP